MHSALLCYVTDRGSLPGGERELLQVVRRCAAAGVDWIQVREKDLPAARLAALTREALRITASAAGAGRTRVLVNDRLDVAFATGAGGVHLAENSLSAEDVVRWLRSSSVPAGRATPRTPAEQDFLVGASCHSLDAARAAERAGVSYIFFGPVFATPSKAAFGAPQGIAQLGEICRAVKIPVLAIGGITAEKAAACIGAGAAGIAAIRLFQDCDDPARAVRGLRSLPAR